MVLYTQSVVNDVETSMTDKKKKYQIKCTDRFVPSPAPPISLMSSQGALYFRCTGHQVFWDKVRRSVQETALTTHLSLQASIMNPTLVACYRTDSAGPPKTTGGGSWRIRSICWQKNYWCHGWPSAVTVSPDTPNRLLGSRVSVFRALRQP